MENDGGKKRRAEDDINTNEDKMPKTTHSPTRTRRGSIGGQDNPITENAMKAMLDAMEGRMSGRHDRVESRLEALCSEVTRNQSEVKEVRKMVEDNETKLMARMDGQRKHLEALIATNAAKSSPTTGASRLSPKNEEAYWLNRRSLSVWPVYGEDASAGLRIFFLQRLKLTEEQVKDLGKISIRRMKEPLSKARKEVFCSFETKETRDMVKACSKNLAGEGADVGLRAQFPGILMDTFRNFETIAYHLRGSDPNIRRAVKFDDSAMDLVMDVRIGDEWRRIKPSEARKTLEENAHIKRGPTEMSSESLTEILSKSGRTPATGANTQEKE